MIPQAVDFLNDWLDFQARQSNLPGLSIAIHRQKEIILSKTYGYTNITTAEPLTNQHAMCIGSQTKMFTATALALLAAQGKLQLDDYACQWLPWLKYHKDTRIHGVTIEQLLTHRAGLIRDGLATPFWQLEAPFPDASGLQDLVLAAPLTQDNYAGYKYSNLGYALLGQIIHAASGQPYEDYIATHLLRPLTLNHTSFQPKLVAGGYTRPMNGQRWFVPGKVATHSFSAATGLYATTEDMCRFMAAQFGDDSFLPAATRHFLHQPHFRHWAITKPDSQYSTGFSSITVGDDQLIGHNGGFIGHRSCSFYNPRTGIGVAIMSNSKDAPVQLIAQGIFSVFAFFERYATKTPDPHQLKLNVRVMNLWMTIQIIATSNKIIAARLGEWLPFLQVDELAQVGNHTLKIINSLDTHSPQELVKYFYKDTRLTHVNYAGSKLQLEQDFEKSVRSILMQ